MTRKKIGIVNPRLGDLKGGGGVIQGIWVLEALKDSHDLTLITTGNVNFKKLNTYCGTSIKSDEIKILKVPHFVLNHTDRFTSLRFSALNRFSKKISPSFDIMFSTYSVMDFGQRGIQYIGDLLFSDELCQHFYKAPQKRAKSWFYKDSILRRAYMKLCQRDQRSSKELLSENLTLVNSEWTAELIKRTYGINPLVVYPPVAGGRTSVKWEDKEMGFVLIGKLVPFKQVERAIEIIRRTREKGFDVHLHIIGWIEDSYYAKNIEKLCRAYKSWCFLEGEMFGEQKWTFIDKHRFGIHSCWVEAFGVAVAELAKAGCIVWVPNGGGQVEVVDHPMLIYEDVEDAVRKITRVLEKDNLQTDLRQHLSQQSEKFSTETFSSQIKKIVQQFQDYK
ncbi:MAG: glycosyltransferase [Candidatus Aminicenantes bacterium]